MKKFNTKRRYNNMNKTFSFIAISILLHASFILIAKNAVEDSKDKFHFSLFYFRIKD